MGLVSGALYAVGEPPRRPEAPVRLAVLGATGSIGTQMLDLVLRDPERLRVTVLTACTRTEELAALVRRLE
ncbi:MAG: hypothetical protein KDG56_20665, partial [Ottowia sp.]|nr:hypothetical protein [Ottowia sp.]